MMTEAEMSLNEPNSLAPEILASLEPDQLTGAKQRRLPRRPLKGSEILLLWALRLYLLFMVGVVVYQFLAGA
jgi:hypothetical protein